MKAARRQELKSNELAQSIEDLREFFRNYGTYVVGGLVIVAVVLVGYVYNTRSAQQAQIEATKQMRELPFATDEEVRASVGKLTSLGAQADDDAVVLETLRRRALFSLQRAHAAEDGTPSAEFLDLAASAYQEMLDRFGDNPIDCGMALIGLATVEEDRFVLDSDQGHKDKAKSYLERVRDNEQLTGTPFQSVALERLNALDRTFVTVAIAAPPLAPLGPPPGAPAPGAAPDTAAQAPAGTIDAANAQTATAQPAKPSTTDTATPGKKNVKKRKSGRPAPLLRPVESSEVPASIREQVARNLDKLEEEMRKKDEAKEAKKKAKKKAEPKDESKTDDDETNSDSTDDQASDSNQGDGDE